MYIKNGKFLVLGLGKSGYYACKLILDRGGKCAFFDQGKSSAIMERKLSLEKLGATEVKSDAFSAVKWCDQVVISPGIPIDNEIAVFAKKNGKAVISELDLGLGLVTAPIVAVTGTNGKTTTATLINEIVRCAGLKSQLLGNIGEPVTKHIGEIDDDTVCVTEVSSFQMESTRKLCPHIAVELNVTPDHLERHYTLDNYVYLKRKLLQNSTNTEFAVLNYDDLNVRAFARQTKAKCVFFSVKYKVEGAYVSEGKIYYFDKPVMPLDVIKTVGEHNVSNTLASVCVAKLLNIADEAICQAVGNFYGVRHRMEKVYAVDEISYIDDSKATNVDSTIKAIKCMKEPTVIILGGKDKGLDYNELFSALKDSSVIHAVLTGENKNKMLEYAVNSDYKNVSVANDFENAVTLAKKACPVGGNVLLSPATSSFDCFKNFEERGDSFVRIVKKINESI
ncbi:MAG: UDP-N-acetylmuramoyl-L-alanine--D-glutamate ligase [Christensenellaceae bacterium]